MPQRQPVRWIGLAVTLILGAVATLSGEGVISDALAGQITDATNAIAQLVVLALPLLGAILASRYVTPVPPDQRGL